MFRKKNIWNRVLQLRKKGSYTIEASVIFPIIVWMIVLAFSFSTELYQKVVETAGNVDTVKELDTESMFLQMTYFKEFLTEILN